MNKVIYIGKSHEYITHFKKFWQNIIVLENYNIVLSNRSEYADTKCLLFEGIDVEVDNERLSQLRKVLGRTRFILIAENQILKDDAIRYLKNGVVATLSPKASDQVIEQAIGYFKKKDELTYQQGENKSNLQVFHMPLGKRIFDIVMSIVALAFLSPLLILIIILIRLESKGPIVYKSKRVGSNYKIFDFLKFRSMYPDADQRLREFLALNQYAQTTEIDNEEDTAIPEEEISSRTHHNLDHTILVADDFQISEAEYIRKRHSAQDNAFIKYKNDPRITKVGRFIRKYSIDELPQLINILKGDMSFVGNRPLPLYEAELLTTDNYIDRFIAPAGLTGLWQVEKRGGSAIMSAEERKKLDIKYAQNCSFWYDMKILFKTFFTFIQKENV